MYLSHTPSVPHILGTPESCMYVFPCRLTSTTDIYLRLSIYLKRIRVQLKNASQSSPVILTPCWKKHLPLNQHWLDPLLHYVMLLHQWWLTNNQRRWFFLEKKNIGSHTSVMLMHGRSSTGARSKYITANSLNAIRNFVTSLCTTQTAKFSCQPL